MDHVNAVGMDSLGHERHWARLAKLVGVKTTVGTETFDKAIQPAIASEDSQWNASSQ